MNRLNTANHRKPKAHKDSLRFKRIKFSFFLSGLSLFSQLYIFQPMLPYLCRDFHINPATSSWAVSASTLGMAAGLFFFSFRADSFDRKKLMVYSLIISSILTIITGLIPSFTIIVITSFIKGALLSGVSSVALAYLNEEVSEKVIGLAISLYLSGNATGGMSGRIISAFLAGWVGWRTTTFIVGAMAMLVGFWFFRLLPSSRHFAPKPFDVKQKLDQMAGILRNGAKIRLYIAVFMLMGCFVSIYNYFGFRLSAAPFNLPDVLVSGIFIMYSIGIVGSVTAGRLSDNYKPVQLIFYFLSGLVIGLSLMFSNHLFIAIAGLTVFTFSYFGTHALASRIITSNVNEGKSSVTSLYWLFYYSGSAFIGTSSGVLMHQFGWSVFIMSLICLVFMSFILIRLRQS